MKKIILMMLVIASAFTAYSQGCVALRSTGGYCSMQHTDDSKWQLSITGRYFKSFRHFVGKEEQVEREKAGTEVINHQVLTDLAITHYINPRWSIMVDMPLLSNTRSSIYEHPVGKRNTTRSFGVGDMRVAAYAWLFDSKNNHKGNIQLGAGVKLPTGN